MPQYRVLQKSFVGNRIVDEGEIVDYDGEIASNLEPVELPPEVKKGKKAIPAPADSGATDGLV